MTYFHTMGTILLTITALIIVINVIRRYMRETEREVPDHIASDSAGMIDNRVEPSTQLIIEGFYLYTDESSNKTLRDIAHQILLEATLDRVIYDEEKLCLICFLPGGRGLWLYYITDRRKEFKKYAYIKLKQLDNRYHTYGYANRTGVGILNSDYMPLTKAKYASLKAVFEKYFLAEMKTGDAAESFLLDSTGTEVLTNISYINPHYHVADKILVKDLQDQYFFFNLSDYAIINLSYAAVWPCTIKRRSGGEVCLGTDLLIATVETGDRYDGYDIKKCKDLIIDNNSREIFLPKYDIIVFLENEREVHFGVGIGERLLWETLAEDFENFDGSSFKPMLCGVIDASGHTIIPVEYTYLDLIKKQFYKVGKNAQLDFSVDYGGYAYDEPFWCWEVTGGPYGLYDSKGSLLLPLEYDNIDVANGNDLADFKSIKDGQEQYWKIEGTYLIPVPDSVSGSNL